MHRKFIALIVSATFVLTAVTAAPARADQQDLARVLAGIAALAIIGKAINDRNDRDPVVTRQYHHKPQHRYIDRRPTQRLHVQPRPLPPRVARRTLPGQCVRVADTPNGTRRVLGARCLERNYRFASQLPRSCSRQIYTNRGVRWAYGARCLRRNGFEIAGY